MRPALPDLTIRQLEYLVAVDAAPTWAAAAAGLGVTPSALSQGLTELERRLGVTVFERRGRRRALRDEMTPVIAHARAVLGLTSDLASWADRTRSGRTGPLRLGMIDASATGHHSEVLHDFRRRRPDVELRLTVAPSAELLAGLVDAEIDLAVCVAPPRPASGIDVEVVATDEMVVYAPAGADHAAGLQRWGPWVLFPRGSHTRALVDEALAGLGAAPLEVVAESHQPEVLAAMVRLGLGWTVLPRIQAGGPEPLEPIAGEPLVCRHLVAARRRDGVPRPVVDDVLRALRRP